MSFTFTKLFSSLPESTIWMESDQTRIVWITMLAMCDRRGRVWASVPGLANRARVPVEACRDAIKSFLSPDPDSRTPDNEGRRVEQIEGGWRLLNYDKYRAIRDAETIKESKRNYINARRAKEREESANANQEGVEQTVENNSTVEHGRPLSTQAEAEAEAEAENTSNTLGKPKAKRSAVASPTTDAEWISSLKVNPAYASIDVDREFGKMSAWCSTNRKEPTRRRFINWLNRVEKPMSNGSSALPGWTPPEGAW